MSETILFLKCGSFSNINSAFLKILETEFPEFKIQTCDVGDLLRQRTSIFRLLPNIYFFVKEYVPDILKGHKKISEWRQWFFATSYISKLMSKAIRSSFGKGSYRFSIQTQSIFNGKVDDTPHYVYTDHTTKTNLLYPGVNPKCYLRSKSFIKECESKIYADATKIFTCGTLPAWSLVQQYGIPKEKVITIYAGSNISYRVAGEYEKKFTKNILFVGLDWERKGGPILMQVFEKVLLRHPDASLTIVGCTPQKLNLPNVHAVGKIPVKEVRQYYEDGNIFVMPTKREPFGIAFIEAMNFQLPIITNNIGSIPDMVVNDFNGYLINGNHIDKYIQVICSLLDNPRKCCEMGKNGYELAKSKFSWDKVGTKLRQNILCDRGDKINWRS